MNLSHHTMLIQSVRTQLPPIDTHSRSTHNTHTPQTLSTPTPQRHAHGPSLPSHFTWVPTDVKSSLLQILVSQWAGTALLLLPSRTLTSALRAERA